MKGTVRVVVNRTGTLRADVQVSARKVTRKTAFDILATTQSNITAVKAVDTGNLLNSFGVGDKNNVFDDRIGSRGGQNIVITIGTVVDYAGHVNYGTVRMPARPFWEPAIEAHRGPFMQAMTHLLDGA